ncbi:hypothetical protein L6164_004229 [Bauhinia variegata]|uniref:Uncharacterized protein n=1 Tax=Bauhinia variegata TaxID=167791 RepID=A0ACB9Q2V0_BAUVA|nr:hypothetical protein L6164_004229 [Bauhinia variegata]
MTSTSMKNNLMPPGLVSNLQELLLKKGAQQPEGEGDPSKDIAEPAAEPFSSTPEAIDNCKPIVLVTNSDGIDSPGLTYLVEALVLKGIYNVYVCVPQSWVFSILIYLSIL